MARLITDACDSAAYLADLLRSLLVEVVHTASATRRPGPDEGPTEPTQERIRPAVGGRPVVATPNGPCWLR